MPGVKVCCTSPVRKQPFSGSFEGKAGCKGGSAARKQLKCVRQRRWQQGCFKLSGRPDSAKAARSSELSGGQAAPLKPGLFPREESQGQGQR